MTVNKENLGFNGAELRLARILNEFSLDEVAEQVGKTRQYIHKLETGQDTPTPQLLNQLASALSIQPEFLTKNYNLMLHETQFHFRKMFTAREMIKQIAMARGELISRLVTFLDQELKLPDLRIPEIKDIQTIEDIERAAEDCRREWGLGLGPISHMSRLAENIGAVVTSFNSVSKEIDALSVAVHRPIIVRNEAKESTCRQRFDIGHELGHFVLHSGIITGDRTTESQANRFASALLIPRTMMAKLFPRPRGSRLDWIGLSEFKLTWKVSKAAILYRAHQLNLINDQQYKSGIITLKRTGEAITEKEDSLIQPELPELLPRSLIVLAEKKKIYPKEIASELKIMPCLFQKIVGSDISSIIQKIDSNITRRAGLHLVVNG